MPSAPDQSALLAGVTAASSPLPPETGSPSCWPHTRWALQLPGKASGQHSFGGEQAGARCHQGLAGWHRPWLLLCPQHLAPSRNCRRILVWEHGRIQSKPCSKPGQPQSQSRMLRATLSISQAGDATTSLGTIPVLHCSCWSCWSQHVPKTHQQSKQGDSHPLTHIPAQHSFPLSSRAGKV